MVFSIPSYLCHGDRYKHVVDERAQGPAMIISRPKTGKNTDALFEDKFTYAWNGERGGNYEAQRVKDALESKKKNLTPNGFVYSSPAQKGEGLGSYYGTIGGVIPYIHRHRDFRTIPAKREIEQRGIYANRPKQGSYGTPNVCLSNVGLDYIATIYDQGRINARREREEKKKLMPDQAFKPCGRRGFTFDEQLGTGASKVYTMTVPFKEKRAVEPQHHFVVDQLWRPAGYVEDKPTNSVVYWEDPYGGYDPRIDPKDLVKKPSEQIFYPSPTCDHFWYTQSIVMKRV